MKAKHEDTHAPTLFYAFVDFGSALSDMPKSWLVPSAIVADVLHRANLTWLATPGKKGQQRNESVMRRFLPDYGAKGIEIGCNDGWLQPYFENWFLIGQQTG
jgi:hypothetical protein